MIPSCSRRLSALLAVFAFAFVWRPVYGQSAEEPAGLLLSWQQDPTTTITIDWHTTPDDEARSVLTYAVLGSNQWSEVGASRHAFPYSDRFIHRTELLGLVPGSEYEFRVGEFGRTYRFRTMPSTLTEPLTFAVGGDVRHSREWMDQMNAIVMEFDPDFIVWGGDLAYADGDPALVHKWYDFFESIRETLISNDGRAIPIVVSIGNHEQFYTSRLVNGTEPHGDGMNEAEVKRYLEANDLYDRKVTFFFDLFAFPGRPAYGVLDFGNYMSIVVLDSNHDSEAGGAQAGWLSQTLKARRGRPHVFPVYHVPAFPSHRPFDNSTATELRTHWVPLFERHGVRVAFENHDHRYKRTPPIRNGRIAEDGIVYIGDGAWGVDVESPGDNSDEWFIQHFSRRRHAILVTVHGPHQHFLVVDSDGAILDEYPSTPVRKVATPASVLVPVEE